MRKRTLAREIALQALYQWEIQGEKIIPELPEFFQSRTDIEDVREYARILVDGVIEHLDKINRILEDVVLNWDVMRLAIIDRIILRLTSYEMLFRPDIPRAVAINEAVELAKKYSTASSGAFVNGILDKLAKNATESV